MPATVHSKQGRGKNAVVLIKEEIREIDPMEAALAYMREQLGPDGKPKIEGYTGLIVESEWGECVLYGVRPETEKERDTRLRREASAVKASAARNAKKDARLRKQYERLKERFGE